MCRRRLRGQPEQHQTAGADSQGHPPEAGQTDAQQGRDHGRHPDAERDDRLHEEKRQQVQRRCGEHEAGQVRAQTEEVHMLPPQMYEIH